MTNDLTSENFEAFLKENETCVIDFWAPWCGPCKMIEPKIHDVCEEKKLPLGGINIDESQNIAQKYGVMSIPTIIKFENGKEVARKIGNVSKESLLDFLG